MSKILGSVFLFLLFCSSAFAGEDIKIISRSEWWADENYRYLDSSQWQKILDNWDKAPKKELTESEKTEALKRAEKTKIANDFLVTDFSDIFSISSVEKFEWDHKLAWPIAKSKKKTSIVIHHTDSVYNDSYEAMRKIYQYHALQRKWWDIGYNYLIWLNGEIFEWRAGGDYVVWAHDKWNNQWTLGVALIWNYDKTPISDSQYQSLEKLVEYLWKKYDIDFNKKVPSFQWCIWSEECDKKPLEVTYDYPIIWHRDAGHTNCPWDELYEQMQKIRKKFVDTSDKASNFSMEKLEEILFWVSEDKLIRFLAIIEEKLDSTKNIKNLKILTSLKEIILNIEEIRNEKNIDKLSISALKTKFWTGSFDDNNRIRVKLSYPKKDSIDISVKWKYTPKIGKEWKEYILSFDDCKTDTCETEKKFNLNLSFTGSQLFLNKKEVTGFGIGNFFRIKSPKDLFLTIYSWDRVPTWDTKGKYNDNKFKWDIVLYQKEVLWEKENELVVVNELFLTDYLKGLWEVSDSIHKEKIRTIIILARTYARWYMTKAEKFVGEWYQASDDPNVFQRYLGFWLEQRSPNVNKIVEETKDLIVTNDGELIKPWYFSSSDGKTKDFIEFCRTAKWVPDCTHPERFPFLIGVRDPGGQWKQRWWHGIWVPGTWVQYFVERGWTYSMIIKYFLKGVEINKI